MNPSKDSVMLILDELTNDQLNEVKNQQPSLIYTTGKVDDRVHYENHSVKKIGLSPEEKQLVNHKILKCIKDFSESRVSNESIGDKLTIDGFSFWYYLRFRAYFNLRNFYYQVAITEKIKKKHSNVLVFHQQDRFDDFYRDDNVVHSNYLKVASRKAPINFKYLFTFFASMTLRTVSSFFHMRKFRQKKHIILTTGSQYGLIGKASSPLLYNKFFAYSLNRTEGDYGMVDLLNPPKIRGTVSPVSFKVLFRKETYTKIGSEAILLRYGPLRPSNWKRIKSTSKHLKDVYAEMKSKESNDPIERFLFNEIYTFHSSSLLFYAQFLAYQKFLSKSELETVSAIDENSSNPKAFLDAAKSYGIRTIGVQHGAIHDLHPSYVFSRDEKKYGPFPNQTLVWGDYYKQFLLKKSCYSPNEVTVIGQLRTDVLFSDEFKDTLKEENLIPTDGKTIVTFASQPQRDENMRKKAAEDFLLATKELGDVLPVIKIHPNETKNYYRSIAASLNCTPLIIGSEVDLLVLLKKTDILATCFSTVGAEAVFMKKPLIVLDYLNQDSLFYIKKGVGIKAVMHSEISKCITDFIQTGFKINEALYDRFIYENAFKIDGNVSERFIQELR